MSKRQSTSAGADESLDDSEREERALRELVRVFHDRDDAIDLVKRTGFPHERLPVFRTSEIFWGKVIEDVRNGVIPGGMRSVLDKAAEIYPANEVLASLNEQSPPVGVAWDGLCDVDKSVSDQLEATVLSEEDGSILIKHQWKKQRSRILLVLFGVFSMLVLIIYFVGKKADDGIDSIQYDEQQAAEQVNLTARIGLYWPESAGREIVTSALSGEALSGKASSKISWIQTVEEDGVLTVIPNIDYLNRFRKGEVVVGAFDARVLEVPAKISVAVANDSDRKITVSEVSVQVMAVEAIRESILSATHRGEDGLIIENYGAVGVRDSFLDLFASASDNCSVSALVPVFADKHVGPIRDFVVLDTRREIIAALQHLNLRPVGRGTRYETISACIYGDLRIIGENDARSRHFRFIVPKTVLRLSQDKPPKREREFVSFGSPTSAVYPSAEYDLVLLDREETYSISLVHELLPGETDRFVIRLSSNESAEYDLNIVLRDVNGKQVKKQRVKITLLRNSIPPLISNPLHVSGRPEKVWVEDGKQGVLCEQVRVDYVECKVDCDYVRSMLCKCPDSLFDGTFGFPWVQDRMVEKLGQGLRPVDGFKFDTVETYSMPELLGLEVGDIILTVNGKKLNAALERGGRISVGLPEGQRLVKRLQFNVKRKHYSYHLVLDFEGLYHHMNSSCYWR